MYEAVIFDMDGLMFDTEPIWASCWPKTAIEFGVECMEGLADAMRGTNGAEAVSIIREWYGDEVDPKAFVDRFYEIALEALAHGAEKKPGLDRLLEYLKTEGIPMAVASSSSREMIKANLIRGGILPYFDSIVSGIEVEHAKPYPDVFLKAADELGVPPQKSLVLEDSYNGVRAGFAGGFHTVMVPDLSEPTEEMERLATAIVLNLNDVVDMLASGTLG